LVWLPSMTMARQRYVHQTQTLMRMIGREALLSPRFVEVPQTWNCPLLKIYFRAAPCRTFPSGTRQQMFATDPLTLPYVSASCQLGPVLGQW
jgi:hypothetical protein